MAEKLTFEEKIRKKYREQMAREDESLLSRSRAYNQYFENWLEYEVTTPKGRKKIIRVYDGAWYIHKLDQRHYVLLKLRYALLWLLSAGLFTLAGFQWTIGNASKPVFAAAALTLIGLIAAGFELLNYIISPRKMTVGQYKSSSEALKKTAKLCTIAFALLFAVSGVYAVIALAGGGFSAAELLCISAYLFGGAAMYFLYSGEKRMEYDILAAQPDIP